LGKYFDSFDSRAFFARRNKTTRIAKFCEIHPPRRFSSRNVDHRDDVPRLTCQLTKHELTQRARTCTERKVFSICDYNYMVK